MVRKTPSIILLVLILCAGSVAQENLLQNGGFEALAGEAVAKWTQPDYWAGSLATGDESRSGKRAAVLGANERDGRHWGRIHSRQITVTPGLRYRFSAWAKGTGEVKLGVVHYRRQPSEKPRYETPWQDEPIALTGDWQETLYEFEPFDAEVSKIAVMIEVEGVGVTATLDDASVDVLRQSEGALEVEPAYVMLAAGNALDVTVRATGTDTVSVIENEITELALSDEGEATRAVTAGEETGLQMLHFASAELGEARTVYVDVVDAATHDAFSQAAAATDVADGSRLLFLGDSLTDFHRGFNYTDQVAGWVSRTHQNTSFRNAGVGGDFITRTRDRMDGVATVYRPGAYEGLFEPVPTHVFISLGHNDSKLRSSTEWTESVVPPAEFEATYREVIKRIQDETGAKVVLLSSTSSVYEITEANAKKQLESRGSASLFGKPDVLENYNAIMKRLAEELGCGYVDIYDPTRAHPDKPSIFMTDGVHVNLEGNHVLALALLRYLGE